VLCFRKATRSAQVASGCLLGVWQRPTVQCACVSRVIFFAAARPAQQSRWANRLRQALPLLSPSFCSTTFRSYHLGKNENNMMAKKGCGTGTRTFTAPRVGSLQCMHSSFSASDFQCRIPDPASLAAPALQPSCLVGLHCSLHMHVFSLILFCPSLPFPYDRLPRFCTRFLNACLTLHATCDLLHLCNF
jgi:hypothetical protein